MSSTTQRKRRTGVPSSSRRTAKSSRVTTTSVRPPAAASAAVPETIDVLESSRTTSEEVVDLTCEGSELTVVDLTNNDSVVVVDEGPHGRREADSESYVLSSDEEEDTNGGLSADLLSSLQASSRARSTPGTVSCPVCMDAYAEIIESGRLVVSTKCGHLFCSHCLRDSLLRSHTCPTCRKKLTQKQCHPIYI
ncbi:E3 ubiquitin-protein ligase RNF4-like [Salvelinus fontinalis]|uniref:E3 ubiquitin-protein ligase RNF4-like n=1 Tax=Salvelinus namaycush TaxID=8040 RepID=A0A8U0QTG1_SALNM|nr:E3 ubiquitin-protein ligase RNF4 [Salvelinus alpinus]XP_023845216.1 E3 ubiquitin-protein ligase RNF4 [Salvelinus alpinus]XP_023845217.1 E3 ubiquitin-protein ligase RNF4 [Salvelinus alpinus]XP_038848970.1 E3 ubiquitin-protein ligase RNF4-like [Salvelinus namaycush]XP_055782454.1 E3 ubiquitin-protein ligase RNF4-like [Salvelinus fontinalis]XP_055782455.1 E3 ubiquitin-protein ligase RNF4-like [Salvelinus fontinalis]XP_055782456.1 E3 ubiquitin-protein ligase RNF4-like [Salvelinus fontinalis]